MTAKKSKRSEELAQFRPQKEKNEEENGFLLSVPSVFGLKKEYSIEDLEKLRAESPSSIVKMVCTWRIAALFGLQKAENIAKRVASDKFRMAPSDYADFVRSVSISSVLASCADDIEGLLNLGVEKTEPNPPQGEEDKPAKKLTNKPSNRRPSRNSGKNKLI